MEPPGCQPLHCEQRLVTHLRDVLRPAGEAHDTQLLVERVVADVYLARGAQYGMGEQSHLPRRLHNGQSVVNGELVSGIGAETRRKSIDLS